MSPSVNLRFILSLIISLCLHALIFFMASEVIAKANTPQSKPGHTNMLTVNLAKKIKSEFEIKNNQELKLSSKIISSEEIDQFSPNSTLNTKTNLSNKATLSYLPLPEPKFYTLNELNQAPKISDDINSNPPELLSFSQGGSLSLQLWIDEDGNVIRAESMETELPKEFVQSTISAFLKAKFLPGIINKTPVKTTININVNYLPLDTYLK